MCTQNKVQLDTRILGNIQFSFFFAVVLFYKVTVNNEVGNTKPLPPRGNTALGSVEPLVTVCHLTVSA